VRAMSEYGAALERAQSRAAVLQSLQDCYGKQPDPAGQGRQPARKPQTEQKPGKSKPPAASTGFGGVGNGSNVDGTDRAVVNEAVETLLACLPAPPGISTSASAAKGRSFFREALRGKALVVGNLSMQLQAARSAKRLDRALKRNKGISNRQLKKIAGAGAGGAGNAGMLRSLPRASSVLSLHCAWWAHARRICGRCHSEAQLQARVHAMELVGVRVWVLEAYIEGDWGRSHTLLTETLALSKQQDGPSHFLLDQIDQQGGTVPADWQGYRNDF